MKAMELERVEISTDLKSRDSADSKRLSGFVNFKSLADGLKIKVDVSKNAEL